MHVPHIRLEKPARILNRLPPVVNQATNLCISLRRRGFSERQVMFTLGEDFLCGLDICKARKVSFGKSLGLVLTIIYFLKVKHLVRGVN